MGSAAVAQADHLPPTQEVQLLGDNGALAVPCAQAVTAVQPKHIHLSVERGGREKNKTEHVMWISDKQG